jgi:hypothetical protein
VIQNHTTTGFVFDGNSILHINTGLKSLTIDEIGIQVSNSTLTVGAEGSIEIPYWESTSGGGSDVAFGDVNGCIGLLRDTDAGPTNTLEARMNGSWVSVALTGYLIQRELDYIPSDMVWFHPQQIKDDKVDETICCICGEEMHSHEQITMYANGRIRNDDLHCIFGHLHPERNDYIMKLESRITELERRLEEWENQ